MKEIDKLSVCCQAELTEKIWHWICSKCGKIEINKDTFGMTAIIHDGIMTCEDGVKYDLNKFLEDVEEKHEFIKERNNCIRNAMRYLND